MAYTFLPKRVCVSRKAEIANITKNTRMMTGTEPILAEPRKRNSEDRVETGRLVYIFALARQISCAPSVAMKGGILVYAMIAP